MIICPNCLSKELIGAVFCSECGAQLILDDGGTTMQINSTTGFSVDAKRTQSSESSSTPAKVEQGDTPLTLSIVGFGKNLLIKGKKELTIGRVSEGQPIIPDIDLSPYKAYESGVSRMHASIKIKDGNVTVTDLGSANGTRINGQIINAHVPWIVKNGDILTLGKFKIQVLMKYR